MFSDTGTRASASMSIVGTSGALASTWKPPRGSSTASPAFRRTQSVSGSFSQQPPRATKWKRASRLAGKAIAHGACITQRPYSTPSRRRSSRTRVSMSRPPAGASASPRGVAGFEILDE